MAQEAFDNIPRSDYGSRDGVEFEICPRCHRLRLARLRRMARYSDLDWFKCDGCEHIFTRPRTPVEEGPAKAQV